MTVMDLMNGGGGAQAVTGELTALSAGTATAALIMSSGGVDINSDSGGKPNGLEAEVS